MPSYDNPLTLGRGTVAVVTGAGSGMGRELALLCARRGCHVAGCDVNQEPMAETVALCKAAAPDASAQRFYGHVCDVSSAEACVGFSEATAAELGAPHINVLLCDAPALQLSSALSHKSRLLCSNNAGFGGDASLFKDDDVFDAILDVNLHGVINMTRAFRDALVAAEQSALVNTSSISGFHVNAGVAYSTSKFAVRGLTEGLVKDFATHAPHVTVHCVMPGYIATDIGLYSTIANYKIHHNGQAPRQELIDRWAEATKSFSENPLGLPQQDAAEIIVNGVEDGEWAILVGDDAEALDKAVRSLPLGGMYFESGGPPGLNDTDGIGNLSLGLAQHGDPSYEPGRQTQLERRRRAKL